MIENTSPPPATIKKEDKSNDLSSMVGLHIEISNRFIDDFERVILFMKWLEISIWCPTKEDKSQDLSFSFSCFILVTIGAYWSKCTA